MQVIMMKGFKILGKSVLVMLFSTVAVNSATVVTKQQANELYQQQNWSETIKAYQQLVEKQPDDEQAWYRMADAHIKLKQPQAALLALEKLSNSQQVPVSQVWYQKAMAHKLAGTEKAMWYSLEQAASAGFRNINEIQNNPLWADLLNHNRMKSIKQTIDKTINPCLYGHQYRDFDFWLGRWEVYGNDNKTGPMYGHNTITQTEQGCLIMEQWQGVTGTTGTSMNYYDGIQQKWVQHWVSGGGTVIDYSGGLIHINDDTQAMRLVGKIYYAATQQSPQIRDFRGTWTPLKNGAVRQFFEESVDGGNTWYTWFDGYYFKVDGSHETH